MDPATELEALGAEEIPVQTHQPGLQTPAVEVVVVHQRPQLPLQPVAPEGQVLYFFLSKLPLMLQHP
jgi:hypothetical protein